jgi:hypothetical protein
MSYEDWFREGNKEKGDWKDDRQTRAAYQGYLSGARGMDDSGGFGGGSDATGMRGQAQQGGWSEDYSRFDDATLQSWETQKDPSCPPGDPYMAYDGTGCVQKPIDTWEDPKIRNARKAAGGDPGGRGQQAGLPPPIPTTFGESLSYSGNPLQDMLIQQFNSRTKVGDPTQSNIFGLGLDREVGGEGSSADKPQMAQALSGGGLWRGSKETFGGFRADQANVAAAVKKPKRGRGRRGRRNAQAAVAPDPAEIAAPPPASPASSPSASPNSDGPKDMLKRRFSHKFGGGGGESSYGDYL